MENKSHAFLAGMFVIGMGAALLAVLFWLGGSHEVMHRYIVVTQQNVNGLNPQAQVKYRGIRVGKVDDIRIDSADPRNILIHISVREDVPLTEDTVARLAYQGVTGLAQILLQERDPAPSAPLAVNDEQPPRIPMQPSLIEELSESGSKVLVKTQQVLDNLNNLFDEDTRRQLRQTTANLARTSEGLPATVAHLNATLGQARKLLSDDNLASLSRLAGEAGPLVGETRELVRRLSQAVDRLDVAIGEAAGDGAAALMPRMNEMVSEITLTSRQLARVLRSLEDAPQSLVFGAPPLPPGPGEPGFAGGGQ